MPLVFASLMGFLFGFPLTALLTAAAAASVPVIIHLLNRRRFRVVPWAAMRFLLAAQRKNTRKMRLEQLLLLLLRVAVVLLLVLAMASVMPWAERLWAGVFPHGALASATGKRTHKILVFDGSFSMALKAGDATCFDRAKEKAQEILRESQGGDAFSVLLMAAPPRRIVSEPSYDARKVADEIRGLHLPHGNADLAATLNAVEDMVRQSPGRFEDREVYFLTDVQKSTWAARASGNPGETLARIQARARTVILDVGQEGAGNLAVTSLYVDVPFVTTGAATPVIAVLHNYGAEARKQVRVECLVGKARGAANDPPFALRAVGSQLIDLPLGQTALTFAHKFSAPGEYAVQIQVKVDNEGLDLDDTRTVTLTVKETVPVLLVNGKPAKDLYDRATEWLLDALNPFQGQGANAPRNVPARPRVLSEAQFADAGLGDLTPYDCVFLCDVKQLGTAEVRRLETHLRRGGGAVVCLGPNVDLENYNRLLYRNGEGLLPARLVARREAPKDRSWNLHADDAGYREPPLLAFAAERDRISLLAARFRQYVQAEPAGRGRARKVMSFVPEIVAGRGRKPDAAADKMPGNEPALVEGTRFRGKVVLLTTTVNMDWASWPISPSFPAMMQELLHFAVAGRLREQSAAVGEALEEVLPLGGAGLEVALRTPDGRAEATRTQAKDDASLFRWVETDVSGLYVATVGQHPQEYLFAVNVPTSTDAQQASESDLLRTNATELRAGYPGWDFQLVTSLSDVDHRSGPSTETSDDIPATGVGRAVARWLLLAMFVLVVVEIILAWRFGHYSTVAQNEAPPAPGRTLPVAVGAVAGVLFVLVAGVLAHAAWTGDFLGFLPDDFRNGVEARLGIPAPASGEGARWHLEFDAYLWDAAADPWLAGLLVVGTGALIYGIYRREGQTAGLPYKLLLGGLRLFFVFLTLAVLLPQLRLWFERQGYPDIAIVFDDSRSMGTTDRYQDQAVREAAARIATEAGLSAPQRLQLAQALVTRGSPDWLERMLTGRKIKIHVYHGSSRAARLADVSEADHLKPALQKIQEARAEGDSSQLGTVVRQVLNDFRGSSLTAIVLLTDGVTTEGEDLVKVAKYASQVGVPLYFVGVGDAHDLRDLRLHDLVVEDSVFVNDRLVFEARVTGQGYKDLTVPVLLKEKRPDGSEVERDRTEVRVDASGKPVKFRLAHRPQEAGEKTYVVTIPDQEGEDGRPTPNTRLERTVLVRESKLIKILYVEGTARYDYRYVKTLLERESDKERGNKTMDLRVLLLDADPEYAREDRSALAEFPPKEELTTYDVVIFGDVDPKDEKVKRHLPALADFVRERGGGFLMLSGANHSPNAYRNTPLADVLPIDILTEPPPPGDREEGYRPVLSAVGRFHSMFRFVQDEAENLTTWNQLPELLWSAEGYRPKPAAEVLLSHPKFLQQGGPARPGEENHALAVQQFVGAGRSLFLGFDETWRWRFRDNERHFNTFWIQTVRYLARSRTGRLKLFLDRQSAYRRGEPIKVMVRFPDDAPPPPTETQVEVLVKRTPPPAAGPAGAEVQRLKLARVEGSRASFEGILARTPEGRYEFSLSAPVVPGQRPRAEAEVVLPPGEVEQLRMNQEDMERCAEETRGKFYTLADADRLPDELPPGTRISLQSPQPPRLVWNHFLIFALALSLLGTEWALRKRKHLL